MSDFVENVSTPAVSDTPATSAPTITSAPVSAPQTTPAVQTQPPATGGEATVPSYRLRQQREQYEQRIAQQHTQYQQTQAELEQMRRQLHSLVGVTPPANPQEDTIRQQFSGLYPDSLAKLANPEVVAKLLQYVEKAPDFEAQTNHYWSTYTNQNLNQLYAKAEETYGRPVGPMGKETLRASLIAYLNSDSERADRYNNGDPTIVNDFWKAYSSELIDPIRRTATASVVDRVPQGLPQDSPSVPRTSAPSQPANLDERVNMAWSQFNKAVRG